jgi:potassium-transporting ATPase KdpC subunit
MWNQLRSATLLLIIMTLLTGVIYPWLITGVAQVIFPSQANGSVITKDGQAIGSELIGQEFTDPRYLWGRPSATGPIPYNAAASTGSNYAATNSAQVDAVQQRTTKFKNAGKTMAIPIELVTASASGLDPHLSPAAALFQVERIAAARQVPVAKIESLTREHIEPRTFGILGEPRVNVLRVNLALDRLQ